jgi:hypothetical protein
MSLQQNPPFQPVSFPPGPPTAVKWEDPKRVYPPYNGQSQTSRINTALPMPAWELGPGPADPLLSAAKATYAGSGYGPIGQGTIGVGTLPTTADAPDPVQVRFFKGPDGNLYILDNDNRCYMVTGGGALAPVPPIYAPTK